MTLLQKAATEVSIDVVRPFRTIPGRAGALVGFDYALPVDRLDGTLPAAIDALRAHHRARRVPLRIEFNEAVWPGLGTAMSGAGFVLESRNPLMACLAETFRPRFSPDVSVEFLAQEPRHPSTLRAVGTMAGVTAGRASLGAIEGVAELYGVITDPPFRRRGVAVSLCSALIQRHFDDGGSLVFLDAENPGAQALYAGLGFAAIGVRLAYRDPNET